MSHWVAFCSGTQAGDGWQPSRRYRVLVTAALVLIGVNLVVRTAGDRGLAAAVAFAALLVAAACFGVTERRRGGIDFATRHPYRDASWSIPIAAVFALVLLPESWPLTTVLAIGGAYVATIFTLAWRGVRSRRRQHHTT